MSKAVLLLMLALSLGTLFCSPLSAAEEVQEVVITSLGNTPEEALENALAEAVVAVAGAVLGERSSLVGEELQEELFQYSRGIVQTYELLEEKTLEKGFSVTLRVMVHPGDLLQEGQGFLKNLRISLPPSAEEKTPPELMSLLTEQLHGYSYEDFIRVEVVSPSEGSEKRLLSFSLELSFDEGLYEKFFAPGVMVFLEAITAGEGTSEFLKKDGSGVFCHVLGSNRRSRSYLLPLEMADMLARALGFSPQNTPWGAAFCRGWVHLSLVDEGGRELERIPLEIPITNTGAFLVKREGSSTPERIFDRLSIAQGEKPLSKSSQELVFTPSFGGGTSSGSSGFFVRVLYPVSFELPEALFEKTRKVLPQLELERW